MDPKTFRETFNQQVAERFDGDPRRLHRYGIHENDCDMGLLVRDGMRTLGKRLRPYLLSEWYRAHGKTASAELTEATFLIELIHNASLVIDDVQDLSPLRRGEPAFRMVHGDSLAINTGILMLFMAVRGAESLHPKIASLVSKHTLALIVGQGKDVLWERHRLLSTPLSEYERMCAHKTGALFALTVQIADELAAEESAVEDILHDLGILYQLCDDIANIDEKKTLGKEFAEDIIHRKPTAVVLAAYQANPTMLERLYRGEDTQALLEAVQTIGIPPIRKRIEELSHAIETRLAQSKLSNEHQAIIRQLLALFSA